jgi:GDP-fucose transporter C1
VARLAKNNLMLKHIGVAFYQVARSSTLIFTIVLSRILLQKDITYQAMIACFLVTCGFFVGIDQEDASGTLIFGRLTGSFVRLEINRKVCIPITADKHWYHATNIDRSLSPYRPLNMCLLMKTIDIETIQYSMTTEQNFR